VGGVEADLAQGAEHHSPSCCCFDTTLLVKVAVSGPGHPKLSTVLVACMCLQVYDSAVPFGGYKSSGIGRDKGECG
jgi:hypothetical protein